MTQNFLMQNVTSATIKSIEPFFSWHRVDLKVAVLTEPMFHFMRCQRDPEIQFRWATFLVLFHNSSSKNCVGLCWVNPWMKLQFDESKTANKRRKQSIIETESFLLWLKVFFDTKMFPMTPGGCYDRAASPFVGGLRAGANSGGRHWGGGAIKWILVHTYVQRAPRVHGAEFYV